MKLIVHPVKGHYKLFSIEDSRLTSSGIVDLAETGRGYRPRNFRQRRGARGVLKPVPPKEFVALLRRSTVYLTTKDAAFSSFLRDMQMKARKISLCRFCLLEDRITPLSDKTWVEYGGEKICYDCGIRELRRELGYLGRFGSGSTKYVEKMLAELRDLDKVISILQPERTGGDKTLFDRIEAHKVTTTERITDLPLPREFIKRCGVETLMPVQHLSYEAGLLEGKDMLIVAATASGKTFIGEMAGLKNYMEGRGRLYFLVPLVALANQKYQRFGEKYGPICNISLNTGSSRLNLPETRPVGRRHPRAPVVVGTYEGIDHAMRCGSVPSNIGTVVIDEVQMLEDPERGHRLDGLIARLKHIAPDAQYLYLSATIGSPSLLAKKLVAELVQYEDRPVPLERHLIFTEYKQKIGYIKQLVTREFRKISSKGYKGQTIVFTNSRARCHIIADALGSQAEPYHAGLSSKERRQVEKKFEKGECAAVITTAALAAGVDFPASQVIFDSLAMGIKWLSVGEFHQMMGRAGRPEFHDLGKIVLLAEPGATYERGSRFTEEEIAVRLLKGEVEEVAPVYELEGSSEETVANAVVCRGDEHEIRAMEKVMVGEMEPSLQPMIEKGLMKRVGKKIELTPLSRVMSEHFIGMNRLCRISSLVREMDDPLAIVAELDCETLEGE